MLLYSPELPPNRGEGDQQERCDRRRRFEEQVLSEELSLFDGRGGLPLPQQSSGGPSTFSEQGVRVVRIAVSVGTTLIDPTRAECSG